MTESQRNKKVIKPALAYICVRDKCKSELNPYHDEHFFSGDDTDWQQLNPERMLEILLKNGWHTDVDGHTYCSPECESIMEIEADDLGRRLRADIREIMKDLQK